MASKNNDTHNVLQTIKNELESENMKEIIGLQKQMIGLQQQIQNIDKEIESNQKRLQQKQSQSYSDGCIQNNNDSSSSQTVELSPVVIDQIGQAIQKWCPSISVPSASTTVVASFSSNPEISKDKKFRSLAIQAFRDFDDFEIIDLHAIDGQGDFELKFKQFSILVDAKLYSNNVNSKARDKIKKDLNSNSRCYFGWLVSMETDIDRFDKSSFMFEWLSGSKCVCYVNSLLKYQEPTELLRSVYFTCSTIYNIVNMEASDMNELNKLKENEIRLRDISQKLLQNAYERDEIITHLKSNFDKNDDMIRQIMNKETNEVVDKSFGRVVDWWNFHIVNEEGCSMRSSNIWTMFKRDNPDLVGVIQPNEFKDILYSFLAEDRIIKPRNKFGALEIKNIRWKVDRGD
jgi:hypothetical protein